MTDNGVIGQLIRTKESNRSSFIIGNPQISYFVSSNKRHTNFAMNTRKLTFQKNPYISKEENKFRCYIDKTGANILNDIYFRFNLPDIYSNDKYKFKWISHFGSLFIKKAEFIINNVVIDTITGEWLVISNELTENVKDNYNNVTGNLTGFLNPKMDIPVITINNNRYANAYPIGNKATQSPSIKGREIIVPLNFNFTKNPNLGILLSKINLNLETTQVYVEITLESIENLYQVYSSDLNLYISPAFYNELYPTDLISFDTFILTKEMNAYIEVNFSYLDEAELQEFQINPQIDIIIEKTIISSEYSINPGVDLVNKITLMRANTHVKEIIWTLKRDDYYRFNNQINYTNSIIENNSKPIMSKAKIMFNDSITRVDENDANFFNIIQPFKHHTSVPKQGIYCYSYSLLPEKQQLSGSVDCGNIETSLYIYTNNQDNTYLNERLKKIGGKVAPYNYKYLLNYYVRTVNVLRYINGTVAYLFAE